LAIKVFEAMKGLPPPLSLLGTVGAGIAGQLKVERISGPANTLEVVVPKAQRLMDSLQDLAEKFDEAKTLTLNVAPSKLGSYETFQTELLRNFKNFEKKVDEAWKRETKSIFDAPARMKLASELSGATTKSFNGNQPTPGIINQRALGVTREIRASIDDMKTLFTPVTELRDTLELNQVAVWVCLQFICDYALSGLCEVSEEKPFSEMKPSNLAAKNFGDPFIDFLDQHVGVIEKDKGGEAGRKKTRDIFASGKIPWQGHPTHKVAVFMYLDWAQRNLNPMTLITASLNGSLPPDFLKQSQDYIKKVGKAIETNAEGAFLGVGHRTIRGNVGDLKSYIK
jgi:hypothetical protein